MNGTQKIVLGTVAATVFATSAIALQPDENSEGWQEPQDTSEAVQNPDKYAWRLFVALNWPAIESEKRADPNKEFGDSVSSPVVWETWRNVRTRAPDTAFKPDGSDPGPWLDGTPSLTNVTSRFDDSALQQQLRRKLLEEQNLPLPAFDQTAASASINETRINKETYEFIREKNLYNLEGQIELYDNGEKSISFPAMAKETKAQWREIENTPEAKRRYHWVQGDDGKVYGLTALHITTKDTPNWFWATFEHIDNRTPATGGGRPGNEGWLLPSVDSFACTQWSEPSNCEKSPKEIDGVSFLGTKWENYVLRGTQLDFIDSRGNHTLLANSQPEETFQLTSSCITCHSRATIGANGNRLTFFTSSGQGEVGSPNPQWFAEADGTLKFTQLDFVWSLFRACAKTPPRERRRCD